VGPRFQGQVGHEDIATQLPPGATLMASSETIENEASCFKDKPIYAKQFHPELSRHDLIARIARYPSCLPLTGVRTVAEFEERTPETEPLMLRFLNTVMQA
jgi:GMP synthase-like glutamine amidotransferase